MLMVKLRFRRWAPSLVPIFEEQFCLAIELTLFYWYSLTICITGYEVGKNVLWINLFSD